MDTSCNHLREPGYQESSFIRARGYLHDLSKPEKEVLLSNLVRGTGNILVENFPDEEDLTQVMQGSLNVLKFKNKIFDPEKCSGMGKVFLRKNFIKNIHDCGKPMNILTLKMFEDEHGLPLVNTMFIIQYDYDLDKGFITIPKDSVLVFAGGSLSNGTVILNNTLILPAALDIEHFMPVNIRGTYREGSLVYLRKHLRLFDGHNWVNLGGHADLGPRDKFEIVELLKAYLNKCLDIVAPFKIELIPEKNYVEKGVHDIKVSWNYNRLISNQDIRLESGDKYKIYQELDKRVREYTFENINAEDPVTIVIATTYKGETVSEAVTLTFDQNPGLVIDDELDENSTNPVTNRAITEAIRAIEERLNSFVTEEELQNTLENYPKKSELQNTLGDYLKKSEAESTYQHIGNYANASHRHVISDIEGLEAELSRASAEYTLDKDGNNIILKENGVVKSTVNIPGIDENALRLLIESKLRLSHGDGTISLKYGTTDLGTVNDEKGSGGGLNPSDVSDLIRNNLDIDHSGTTLKLKYAGNFIGFGTDDMRGGGVDPDPEGDGKIGNILVYFLARTAEGVPKTPQDGQKANPVNSDGETWTENCPDHLDKQYIWMSQIFEAQGGTAYGNWSTPVMIDDGVSGIGYDSDGREFIYARANIEDWEDAGIPNPNTEPDRWPSVSGPWYDNPQGVTENTRFEFYAFKYRIGEDSWSAWVGPFIWSAYGRDGVDGNGVEYIFFKGKTAPLNNNIQNPKNWYTDEQSKADTDKTSFNKDEYILSGSGWVDDPESLEAGDSVWVSIRKYRNDSDTESAEAVGAYWHQYSEPALWSHYGKDAISAGVLDFDNETMTVPVNSETGKNYLFADTAYAYIFYEEGSKPISNLIYDGLYNGDLEITNSNVRVSINNNKVTVLIDEEGLDFSQIKNYALRFTAQSTSLEEDRTGTIKLIGVQSGKDGESYKLSLNTKVVKKQIGTEIGGFIPESIIPKLFINGGDDAGSYTPTEIGTNQRLSERFEIKYGIDGSALLPSPDSIELTNNINTYVVVALLYNENIIDQETVFIIEDGHAGIPATVYNIIPYSSTVVNTEEGVKGILTFKASRKYGNQDVSYLKHGYFTKTEEADATEQAEISVKLNGTYDITEHGEDDEEGLYTIDVENVESSGNYNSIVITLSVIMGDSRTEVASIVIPIAQAGSEGTQTLLKGIMRYREFSDYSTPITFYDGKTPDPNAQNGYFQDFVRWRDAAPNDNWGTYMCINTTEIAPNNIPTTGVNEGNFIKLDYTFTEVTDYLIAKRAWIDNLSVRQVVVFDGEETPNVVAGMTSGSTLPAEVGATNNNEIRIWAGEMTTADINSAPFTVSSSGHLKAEDAEITGDVTATSFNVKDDTGIKMRISTWGDVSRYISELSKALIDSNTMSQLIAHPDTAVIVVRDPSSEIEYLLNLISFSGGGGPGTPVTFYTLTKSNGFVTESSNHYILYNEKYYLNENTLANFSGYEEVQSLATLLPFTTATTYNYRLLMEKANVIYYRKVEITNGEKTYPDENVYTIAGVFDESTEQFNNSIRKDYKVQEIQGPIENFGENAWTMYPPNPNYSVANTADSYDVADEEWVAYRNQYDNKIHQATINTDPSTIVPSNGLTLIDPDDSPTLVRLYLN